MAKQKYNFNGTLLNLLLLGGAAVILKKRTGSLRGVGATDYKHKYRMLALKLYKLTQDKMKRGIYPGVSFDELGVPFQYYLLMDMRDKGLLNLDVTSTGKTGVTLKPQYRNMTPGEFISIFGQYNIGALKRYYYYFMDDDYNVYDTCPIPDGVTKAKAVKIAKQWMAENGFTSGYVVVNSMATGNILDQIEIKL